ncbi:histidine phosphatase family protein [Candidatus Saccharibacteria bacterium]|nr:histidine phosphatase family protein [Candidatus Saccharibacteria bacterium]
MKLYLVRHGETDWNKEGRMQGRKGIGLNEVGVEQIKSLAGEIEKQGLKFDVCYSSPLKRAAESAEILVGGKCEILYDERLVERDFGEFEGKSMEDYSNALDGKDSTDRRANFSEYGIEPIKDVLGRAKSFLDDLKKEYNDNEKILVVAHGVLLKALHFEIIGYDDDTDFHETHFKNAEMREYEI